MIRSLKFTFLALLAGTALLGAARALPGTRGDVPGDPLAGAKIYDNWMLALDQPPPAGDQPLWRRQDHNQRNGVVTWRCVECHGWDYKGADGAYGSYSTYYTGFPGLQDVIGASQSEVRRWLDGSIDPDHNFLPLVGTTALDDLAAFLRTQQVNMDLLINPSTGESLGDKNKGRDIYNANCQSCHGDTGRKLQFGTALEPLFLGDLAVAEPWQTVHKIRFGTPTNPRMPSSEEQNWSLNMVANVLAYLQTLPRANPDYQVIQFNPDNSLPIAHQGQVEPIVWGALAILAVVGANVAWDVYSKRRRK